MLASTETLEQWFVCVENVEENANEPFTAQLNQMYQKRVNNHPICHHCIYYNFE